MYAQNRGKVQLGPMFVAQEGVLADFLVSILYACNNILYLKYIFYILMELDLFLTVRFEYELFRMRIYL